MKIFKEVKCECEEWKVGMEQVNDAQFFASTHKVAIRYTAPYFRYCPWCGKKLKKYYYPQNRKTTKSNN